MSDSLLDLDSLAYHLDQRLHENGLSERAAAKEIGISPVTLGRIMDGAAAKSMPDLKSLVFICRWLGMSIIDFEPNRVQAPAVISDIFLLIQRLPGLDEGRAEALMKITRTAYNQLRGLE